MKNLDLFPLYGDIIVLTALSSEIGRRCFELIGSPRTVDYNISKMQKPQDLLAEDGHYSFNHLTILKKYGKGYSFAFGLTKAASECGLLQYYGLQQYYDSISRPYHERANTALRKKSCELAVAFQVMKKAGVCCHPDYKALPPLNHVKFDRNRPAFYSSREVRFVLNAYYKMASDNGIAYGQYAGLLFGNGVNYIVYCRYGKLTRLNIKAEQRTLVMASEFAQIVSPDMRTGEFDRMIHIVDTIDNMRELFSLSGNASIDDVWAYMLPTYVFPAEHAPQMIGILSNAGHRKLVKEIFALELKACAFGGTDGITPDGEFVFFALDATVYSIRNFISFYKDRPGYSSVMYCFNWQADLINELSSGSIKLKTVDMEKFYTEFKDRKRALTDG